MYTREHFREIFKRMNIYVDKFKLLTRLGMRLFIFMENLNGMHV